MPKCVRCGKRGLRLELDLNGFCPECSSEYYRLRRERAALIESVKKKKALLRLESIPLVDIYFSADRLKRRRGYEPVPTSRIYASRSYGDFVVFDTETTGYTPSRDRIIELGAVRFSGGQPVERFSTLVDPERPIPLEATEVNNITDEMVACAPKLYQILPAFEAFVGNSAMVAHNLHFDLKCLYYSGSSILDTDRQYFDTLEIARQVLKRHRRIYNPYPAGELTEEDYYYGNYGEDYEYNDVENHKLGTLCEYYDIVHPGPHRADADALVTGDLFLRLAEDKVSRSCR